MDGEHLEEESEESSSDEQEQIVEEKDKEELKKKLKSNLLTYLTNKAGLEIKDVIKLSLKERFEKYKDHKQKEEKDFYDLSSYETDSIKSEEDYVMNA